MKIERVCSFRTYLNTNKNLSFKSGTIQETGMLGDPDSQHDIDYLRMRLYERFFPVTDRDASTAEMQFARTLEDVNIKHFKKFGRSSYSGECLSHCPEYFKLFKPSGVQRIIDLSNNKDLKNLCKENQIDYYSYDMLEYYKDKPIYRTDEDLLSCKAEELCSAGYTSDEYDEIIKDYKKIIQSERKQAVLDLQKLIDVVNQGYFYMSCELGSHRTPNCLALVSVFNPKNFEKYSDPTPEFFKKMKIMYENLTPEFKQILGIDEAYDEYLKTYFNKPFGLD